MDPSVTLRPGTFDDIAAAAEIRASAVTDAIITAEGMHNWLSNLPEQARLLLLAAEVDGQLVGWCNAWRNTFGSDPGVGTLDVIVLPDHQRRARGAAGHERTRPARPRGLARRSW